MTSLPDHESKTADAGARKPGLRERKRQEIRKRLMDVAMVLFLERGFEATTINDIVEAVDISRRSFFHYFASKEDVVFAWQDKMDTALAAAVADQPPDVPPLRAAANAIIAEIGLLDREKALALAQLKQDTPILRARDQAKYEWLEHRLAVALSQRLGCEPDSLRARLVAMVAIGTLRIGSETWLAGGAHEGPVEHAKQAFSVLWADFTGQADADTLSK